MHNALAFAFPDSEDFETTEPLENPADRERMYWELKSGAATGWDFSSRWFIDDEGTNNGKTRL